MTICICGHDISKHSQQGCMTVIDHKEDKFCPCELTRMDVERNRAAAEASAAQLEMIMSMGDAHMKALTAERDAFAAENDAIHRAINEMCGTNTSTVEAVQTVIQERDTLKRQVEQYQRLVGNTLAEMDNIIRGA